MTIWNIWKRDIFKYTIKRMNEIIRNRVIRPSTRAESSDNYKVETEAVSIADVLLVNVTHESLGINAAFKFEGKSIADKRSIHFKINESEDSIIISWIGITPIEISSISNEINGVKLIHRLPSQL